MSFSPFYERLEESERELMKDKRKDHGAVDKPSSEYCFIN